MACYKKCNPDEGTPARKEPDDVLEMMKSYGNIDKGEVQLLEGTVENGLDIHRKNEKPVSGTDHGSIILVSKNDCGSGQHVSGTEQIASISVSDKVCSLGIPVSGNDCALGKQVSTETLVGNDDMTETVTINPWITSISSVSVTTSSIRVPSVSAISTQPEDSVTFKSVAGGLIEKLMKPVNAADALSTIAALTSSSSSVLSTSASTSVSSKSSSITLRESTESPLFAANSSSSCTVTSDSSSHSSLTLQSSIPAIRTSSSASDSYSSNSIVASPPILSDVQAAEEVLGNLQASELTTKMKAAVLPLDIPVSTGQSSVCITNVDRGIHSSVTSSGSLDSSCTYIDKPSSLTQVKQFSGRSLSNTSFNEANKPSNPLQKSGTSSVSSTSSTPSAISKDEQQYLEHVRRIASKPPDEVDGTCKRRGILVSTSAALNKHGHSHLETKTFKCTKCGKKFFEISHLQHHIDTNSCDLEHLRCDICKKVLSSAAALKKHKNTHLLIKPYKCTKCEKTFAQKMQLKGHNFTRHGITIGNQREFEASANDTDTGEGTVHSDRDSPMYSDQTKPGNSHDSELVPTEPLPAVRSRNPTPHSAGEPENSMELPDLKRNTDNMGTSHLQIARVTPSPDGISLSSSMSSTSTLEDIDNVGSLADWSSSGITHSSNHMKMYEMGMEPGRRPFLDKLFMYLEKKGTPIHYIPCVDNQPIDLYRLYMIVKERGGSVKVSDAKEWIWIYRLMNFKHSLRVSSDPVLTLMKQYIKFLFAFECEYDHGGIDQALTPEQIRYGVQDRAPATGSQGFGNGIPENCIQNDPSMHQIGHRMIGNPKIRPYNYWMQGGSDPMIGVYRGPQMWPMGMGWYAPNSMMGRGVIGPQQSNMEQHSMIENMHTNTRVSHSGIGPQGSVSGHQPSMTQVNSLHLQQMMRNYIGHSLGPNCGPPSAPYSITRPTFSSVSGQEQLADKQYWKKNSGPQILPYSSQQNSTITQSNSAIQLTNSAIPQPNSPIPQPNSTIPQSNSTISLSNSSKPQSSGPMTSQNSKMPPNTACLVPKGKKQKSRQPEILSEKEDSWYECKKCGKRLQYFKAFVDHVNNGNCRIGIDTSMFDSNTDSQKIDTSVGESSHRSEQRQNDSINRESENIEKDKMHGANFSAQTRPSLINKKVLIKNGDAFYPGIVKTCNKKGTVGVLFDGEEELTYLLNSDSRCIVLDTTPSDDELPVGCMVCVRLNVEQDKYYEGEIVERQVGKWVWYRVCLNVEIHKVMFGEDIWVTNTSLRLLQQSCFTMDSGEIHILTKSQNQVSDDSSGCAFQQNRDHTRKDSLNKFNDSGIVLQDVNDINEDKEHSSDEETEKYASDEEERLNEVELDIRSESSDEDLDTKVKKDQKIRIEIWSESSDDGQGGRMNENSHELKKALPEKKKRKTKRAKKIQTGLNANESVDEDIKHVCDYCDDVFEDAITLRQHRNIHIQKKPFFCEFCEKSFSGKVDLSGHLVICKNKDLHKNEIGKKINFTKSATTVNSSKVTREDASDELKKYLCPFCDRRFSRYSSLWNHKKYYCRNKQIQSSTERKKYYCSLCAAPFFSIKDMFVHKKEVHKNQKTTGVASIKKKYECKLCQSFYNSYVGLWSHRKTTHKNDEKQDLIRKKISESDSLKTKLNSREKSTSPTGQKEGTLFVCGICNKKFSGQSYYDAHQRIHWKKKPFACKKCKRQFAQKVQLEVHKCVTATSNFKCDYCGAAFPTEMGLKIHRGRHSEENEKRKHCCHYCEKKYKNLCQLQSHMVICKRTHNIEIEQTLPDEVKNTGGNQAYERQLVPEKDDQRNMYLHKDKLQKNQKMTSVTATKKKYECKPEKSKSPNGHKSGTVYICGICNKEFSWRSSYWTHQRIHWKKKPFACKKCKRQFVQKENLNKHICVTGSSHLKCDYCDAAFASKQALKVHSNYCDKKNKNMGQLKSHMEVCKRMHSTENVQKLPDEVKNTDSNQAYERQLLPEKDDQSSADNACTVCYRTFSTKKGLSVHNFRQHYEKRSEKIVCTLCNKRFSSKVGLEVHYWTVHKNKSTHGHRCSLCSRKFPTKIGLARHNLYVHKEKSNAERTSSSKAADLAKHNCHVQTRQKSDNSVKQESSKNDRTCDICNRTFITKAVLAMHNTNVHKRKGKRPEGTINPEKSHQNQDGKTCLICSRQFSTRAGLSMHNYHAHKGSAVEKKQTKTVKESLDDPAVLSHTCAICSSTFRSGEELHKHFKLSRCALGSFSRLASSKETTTELDPTEQIETQVKYECATCDIIFADCSYLELHMSSGCPGRLAQTESAASVSEGVEKTNEFGSFECGLCLLKFESDTEMISHFKLEHSVFENKTQNSLEYVCGKCKSEFDSAENLGFHMQYCFQGNNSSVFTCGICQKDYRNAYELESHMSEIHTQSEYLCGQCGQSFNSTKSLVNHVNEHSTVKDEAGACPDFINAACEDTGTLQNVGDQQNDAVILKTDNKDAFSIKDDTNRKEVGTCKERTIEVHNCSGMGKLSDNKFVSNIPVTLNSTLVTHDYRVNSSKTSSSTDVCSNPITSLTEKELNNINKQSDVLVDNSIKGDHKQTDLRPRIDTSIYQHLYKPKTVLNEISDNLNSKSDVKDTQSVPNVKGYAIKHSNEQHFDMFDGGVETVPTSLLLRFMHQVQCDGCWNITKLNASGMCTNCMKPIVVKLHKIMCMCMHYCFRSIEVLTAHLRGCKVLQDAVANRKHLVLSYSKQEGTRKISEADLSIISNLYRSECSISPVKNSSDSLLQGKHNGNNSNENRTVSYDGDKSNKTNEIDSNENQEMMEENPKSKPNLVLVNEDKMQDVDSRKFDEPIIILDDYESESSETDSTGFEEICIDMIKDENNSEKPCGDNNGNSVASSETALHRAFNEHCALDRVKYDQTLITSNIFSCKVILERMPQFEVEHHLRKRTITSVAASEKSDRLKQKQTKLEQFYVNSPKQRTESKKRKLKSTNPLSMGEEGVAGSNKDDSNLEQQDTIVISSDSDNDSQTVDLPHVDETCSETNNMSDKNRMPCESSELNSSLVSKTKSVARKRGYSKSNKTEHNSQKRRCAPKSKTFPKSSKSEKSVKDGNRTATVDSSYVIDIIQSASSENKGISNHEKLKSSSASKTAENLEKHANTQLKLELFKCSKCERVFSSADSLSAHMDSHKKAEEFVCGICKAKFTVPEDLESHLVTHFESVVASKGSSTGVTSSEMTEIVDADSSTPTECPKQKDVSRNKSLLSKLIAYKPNIKL